MSLSGHSYDHRNSDPDAQRLGRTLALLKDFAAWRAAMLSHHRVDVGLEDLHRAVERVAGPDDTPAFAVFKKYLAVQAGREMPPRLECAWAIVTGGEHLRIHHEQAVYGLHYRPRMAPQREILAGMEVAA